MLVQNAGGKIGGKTGGKNTVADLKKRFSIEFRSFRKISQNVTIYPVTISKSRLY